MKLNIEDVMNEHFSVDIDEELYKQLKNFRLNFVQKDQSYIEFFGGSLTGVIPIRFSSKDDKELMEELLHINKDYLYQDIIKCRGVNKNFKTITNPIYITLLYIIHKFNTNKKIDQKTRIDAVTETYLIMGYKMLCSLLSHYFKYDLDISIAKAVYERLTGYFLLKQLNSWQDVMEYRAKDLIEKPPGVHYKRTLDFNIDTVSFVLSDLQSRLRDMVKNIYSVLIDVIEQNERINSSSLLIETEDGKGIRDSMNNQYEYINYLLENYKRPNEFIQLDIVDLVVTMFDNVKTKNIIMLCQYFSDGSVKNASKLIEDTILLEIKILAKKGYISEYKKDIIPIASALKGSLSSSRINDRDLSRLRNEYKTIIKKLFKNNNTRFLSIMTTAMMLYLFFRAVFNNK